MMESEHALHANGASISYTVIRGAALLELRSRKALRQWELNRGVDEERVARLVRDQVARLDQGKGVSLFLPVPITVCRHAGVLYLIDGQHRAAALERLRAQRPESADSAELLLCTVQCDSAAAMEDVFLRVNSGTPVPAAYYANKVNVVISTFLERLILTFPGVAGNAAHPQRPRFNLKTVRDEMSSLTQLRDSILNNSLDAEALSALAVAENEIEQARHDSPKAASGVPPRCLAAAAKTGFYLGLQKGWPLELALRAVASVNDD